jgi:fumarate reductase subunit C
MAGWWRRNPYFIEYMVHEGTALFVAAYALLLLSGAVCLAAGEAAWDAWLRALRSAPGMVFSLLTLAAFLYHAWTWFRIMPRTLPPLHIGQRRLSARAIANTGLAVATATNLLLWGFAAWLAR